MSTKKFLGEINRLKKIAGLLKEELDLSDTPEFIKKSDLHTGKITNVTFDGIDHNDYPDYVDAYVVSADIDGRPMTEEEIDELNGDSDLVYDLLMDYLY